MTIQGLMREILRMVADPDGSHISKEFMLQLINEETKIVCAKFPSQVRINYTPAADGSLFNLTDIIGDAGPNLVIKKVLVGNDEYDVVGSAEAERWLE